MKDRRSSKFANGVTEFITLDERTKKRVMTITSYVHVRIVAIQSHIKLQTSSTTYSSGDSWMDIHVGLDTVKSWSWMKVTRAA
jgi:hypothetical protein